MTDSPPGSDPVGHPTGSWSVLFDDLQSADESMIGSLAKTPGVGMVPEPLDGEPPRETFVGGLVQAGPLAIAGLVANAINILATVLVARALTTREYGTVAQLLGLFFILSMPGSAVLVAVVRRVTATPSVEDRARWVRRLYHRCLVGVGIFAVVAVLGQRALARALSLPNDHGVAAILVAGGVWLLVSIDRGVLQAGRQYRPLAANLLVESGVRTSLVICLTVAGLGVWGYGLGFLAAEIAAALHARRHARASLTMTATPTTLGAPPGTNDGSTGALGPSTDRAVPRPMAEGPPTPTPRHGGIRTQRRSVSADVTTALVGFALLGILQNADVILVGRLHPGHAGAYAAISVAAKSLVFGAILLGSYVLPEATIRWNQGHHALRQLGVTLLFLLAPALVLLAMAIVVPKEFLTVFFSARLDGAAHAFAPLVGAMTCLGITVILTNYLFGAARRWIIVLLAVGACLAVVLIDRAGGRLVATADADLVVQAGLLGAALVAFVAVHVRHRRLAITMRPRRAGLR